MREIVSFVLVSLSFLFGFLWLCAYVIRSGWNAAAPKPRPPPKVLEKRAQDRQTQ